jgi:O-antigen/teichoic acid export membrane protein
MPNEEYLNESLRKIAKGAGIVFIGTGIGMFFAYLGMMIVARFLGPTDFGLITLASAVATIASTVVLVGLPEGVVRYVSFYKGKNDEGRIKGVIVSALKVVLPLGIVASILLFVFADFISIRVFHDPNLTPILKIFSFSVPFFALFQIFNYAIGGLQEMRYMVYVRDIFQNSTRLFLLVVLLLLGYGVLGAAFAYTFAIVATPFVAFYYLNKIFPVFSEKIKAVSMKRELLSFSWPLMFAGILGLVMGWIDTLMLGYFLTAADVGIYRASLSTAGLLMIVPSSFGAIFFPVITEFYSKKQMGELKDTNAAVTKWIVMIVLPLVLLMVLFSKQVLYILYGAEYVTGALVLCILGFGYLIISVFNPTNQLIPTIGRTKLMMVNTSVGAALDVILNFWLIPIYGIDGAAVATGISLLTVNALAFAEVLLITRIQPIKSNYVKIVFASFASIFVVYMITRSLFEITPIFLLILMFILYMGLYFCLLLVLRTFEKEDVIIMRAIEARSGIKSEWIRKMIGRFL